MPLKINLFTLRQIALSKSSDEILEVIKTKQY